MAKILGRPTDQLDESLGRPVDLQVTLAIGWLAILHPDIIHITLDI